MNKKLKVLVSGTGFAGQGHTDAFRNVGAEVVGIVGRTPNVVTKVASKMNIPYSGTNWQKALKDCQPDIVSIATPGGAHYNAIKQAIEHGCHVYSDKPLTVDGDSAKELHELAVQKNVKTAFASSFRYMPCVLHAKRLVANGAIGEPVEAEFISHFNLEEALIFIEKVNPKRAYLTHISHLLGFHDEVEQTLPKNVFLAYDGLKITL